MRTFTYENQGQDTLLVYHLDQEEHMDHFAKGMLQSNDISGILKPSFIQKDTDRYLKYPVTSRISLKDYLDHQMSRESVLKLCLSLVETVQELDEYMLSRDKIFLSDDYLFVDVSRQRLSLLYVPVDEFTEENSVEEFLKHFLSHIRFCMNEDVTYVAKVLNFLNKSETCEMDKLKRWLQFLVEEKAEPKDNHPVKGLDGGVSASAGSQGAGQNGAGRGGAGQAGVGQMPAGTQQSGFGQPPVSGQPSAAGRQTAFGRQSAPGQPSASGQRSGFGQSTVPGQPPIPGRPPIPGQPPIPGRPPIPGQPPAYGQQSAYGQSPVPQPPVKEKKGLFKKKKEREMQIPGIAIPGNPAPGANVPPAPYPGVKAASQPEVVLNANEEGRILLDQAAQEKKKGLFHFNKKQKAVEIPPTPQPFQQQMQMGATANPSRMPSANPPRMPSANPSGMPSATPSRMPSSVPPQMQPGVPSRMPSPAPSRTSSADPAFRPGPSPRQMNQEPDFSPSYSQSDDGHTIYMGSGSSDDENHTVIMGGGEEGHTVMRGGEQYTTAPLLKQAARLTRRRTGQSKEITKEVFHIGREGGFVHFYIGDNPTIGAIHADIFLDDGSYFISDRNSVNHTYVNGTMVMAGQPVQLKSGDIIQLSDEQFEFIIS